jgi:hypothetical protein
VESRFGVEPDRGVPSRLPVVHGDHAASRARQGRSLGLGKAHKTPVCSTFSGVTARRLEILACWLLLLRRRKRTLPNEYHVLA